MRITKTDVLLLTMAVIWGVNYSVVKFGAQRLPPFAFNALRVAIGGAILLVLAATARSGKWPARGDVARLMALGILGNCVYQALFIQAISLTRAGNVAIVLASSPAWLALAGRLGGTEHISRRTMAGIAASIIGVAAVVLGSSGEPELTAPNPALGNLLALAGCISWAVYTVLLRPHTHRTEPLQLAALTMVGGAIPFLLVATPDLISAEWSQAGVAGWSAMAYGSIMALVVAYLMWYHGVRTVGPTRTAMYANFQPVVALAVAAAALGEIPTPWQVVGGAAIMSGILLTRV